MTVPWRRRVPRGPSCRCPTPSQNLGRFLFHPAPPNQAPFVLGHRRSRTPLACLQSRHRWVVRVLHHHQQRSNAIGESCDTHPPCAVAKSHHHYCTVDGVGLHVLRRQPQDLARCSHASSIPDVHISPRHPQATPPNAINNKGVDQCRCGVAGCTPEWKNPRPGGKPPSTGTEQLSCRGAAFSPLSLKRNGLSWGYYYKQTAPQRTTVTIFARNRESARRNLWCVPKPY